LGPAGVGDRTGLDVWEIVEIFKDYGEIEPMVADSHLTERQVKLALAYYGEYPEAIDAALRDNRRSLEELHQQYPTIDVIEVEE
jgi:uncharacterized protein (DUF433 family)